jgi:hypothetical protein
MGASKRSAVEKVFAQARTSEGPYPSWNNSGSNPASFAFDLISTPIVRFL